LESPSLKDWAKEVLYDGECIKEAIVELYRDDTYGVNFSDENPPTVTIAYGEGNRAVFQLDGYDPVKKVGYKFVTEADRLRWEAERKAGNLNAPDLSQYELIQASALDYDFSIVFYYYPRYWESRIPIIIGDPNENVLPKLKSWLNLP
jgi:hypothetical protein